MVMEHEDLEPVIESTLEGKLSPDAEEDQSKGSSRKLWDWLAGYEEYNEEFEPPKIFSTWVGLLTLAAATQRRVWLEDANNRIYPNLFVVLVAPSGVGKTSAMREAMPFIEASLGPLNISPSKITGAQFAKRFAEANKMGDGGLVTPYLIFAEELPSFLGPDAYKTGMIADLTALYDCPDRWVKETKKSGVDDIAAPYLCLMGGTTAQGIFDVLPPGAVTQGFTARLIFIHATYNRQRVIEKPWGEKQQKLRELLLHDIQQVAKLKGGAKLSDVARTLWADYYYHRPQAEEEFSDQRLQGYAARKPFYAKKIALLLSVSEGDSLVVEAHHIEKALGMLAEIDESLKQVYDEIAPSVVIQHYPRIIRKLKGAKGCTMSHAGLRQAFSNSLTKRDFEEAVQSLIEMGLVKKEFTPMFKGATRGTWYYELTEGGKKWKG